MATYSGRSALPPHAPRRGTPGSGPGLPHRVAVALVFLLVLLLIFLLMLIITAPVSGVATTPAAMSPVFFVRGRDIWRIGADGAGAAKVGITVDGETQAELEKGSSAPLLSPDRRWFAFIRGRNLWLSRVDGHGARQITRYGRPEDRKYTSVNLMITGWSPDSRALIFYLLAGPTEDPEGERPPLRVRHGVPYGFHVLNTAAGTSTRLPTLSGFIAWADPQHVLIQREVEKRRYTLFAFPLAGGQPRPLLTITDPYGFSQLNLYRDEIAFVQDGRIVRAGLDGTGLPPLTPRGSFAEYQWPAHSPDGRRIAYARHRTAPDGKVSVTVMVADLAAGRHAEVARFPSYCLLRWHDDGRLLMAPEEEIWITGPGGSGPPRRLVRGGTLISVGTPF